MGVLGLLMHPVVRHCHMVFLLQLDAVESNRLSVLRLRYALVKEYDSSLGGEGGGDAYALSSILLDITVELVPFFLLDIALFASLIFFVCARFVSRSVALL